MRTIGYWPYKPLPGLLHASPVRSIPRHLQRQGHTTEQSVPFLIELHSLSGINNLYGYSLSLHVEDCDCLRASERTDSLYGDGLRQCVFHLKRLPMLLGKADICLVLSRGKLDHIAHINIMLGRYRLSDSRIWIHRTACLSDSRSIGIDPYRIPLFLPPVAPLYDSGMVRNDSLFDHYIYTGHIR